MWVAWKPLITASSHFETAATRLLHGNENVVLPHWRDPDKLGYWNCTGPSCFIYITNKIILEFFKKVFICSLERSHMLLSVLCYQQSQLNVYRYTVRGGRWAFLMSTDLWMRIHHNEIVGLNRRLEINIINKAAAGPYMAQHFPTASSLYSGFSNQAFLGHPILFVVGELVLVTDMIPQDVHCLTLRKACFSPPHWHQHYPCDFLWPMKEKWKFHINTSNWKL